MPLDELFDLMQKEDNLSNKNATTHTCTHEDTIFDKGTTICTTCGLEICYSPVYVRSYNRTFTFRHPPVYSRQKRFCQYVISLCNNEIGEKMEDILLLFARIEFFWNVYRDPVRKYFFNRNVVLFFITNLLELSVKPKTLKDENRVIEQLAQITELLKKNTLFK